MLWAISRFFRWCNSKRSYRKPMVWFTLCTPLTVLLSAESKRSFWIFIKAVNSIWYTYLLDIGSYLQLKKVPFSLSILQLSLRYAGAPDDENRRDKEILFWYSLWETAVLTASDRRWPPSGPPLTRPPVCSYESCRRAVMDADDNCAR